MGTRHMAITRMDILAGSQQGIKNGMTRDKPSNWWFPWGLLGSFPDSPPIAPWIFQLNDSMQVDGYLDAAQQQARWPVEKLPPPPPRRLGKEGVLPGSPSLNS